ncbi:hypothetical protein HK098_007189 [Nowakowskiella sp. JEL0407]|nr:hypothetical protein HK098_007189 [Nowakowskiella sp. JEL0407]
MGNLFSKSTLIRKLTTRKQKPASTTSEPAPPNALSTISLSTVEKDASTVRSISGGGSTHTVDTQVPVDSIVAEKWQPENYHMMRIDARMDQRRRFHAVEESLYPLPADIQEQDRLELQHLLYRFAFNEQFHMPIHDKMKKTKLKLLDCGCGPGAWMREVAETYPLAELIGIDMAQSLFNGVEVLPNMKFMTGNVLDRLPFDDNTFDGVYQRLLVAAVPKDKWDHVISELIRVTKPGGYIEMCEPDIDLIRMGPNYTRLSSGTSAAMSGRGLNIKIPYEIADKMQAQGVTVLMEKACSFPIGWGGRHGDLHLIHMQQAALSMKPFLSKSFVAASIAECPEYQTYYNAFAIVGQKPLVKA